MKGYSFLRLVTPLALTVASLDRVEPYSKIAFARKQLRPRTAIACSSPSDATTTPLAFVTAGLSREEGRSIIDGKLMPKKEYSARIGWGRDAQGIDGTAALKPNDPRLSMTYAEFPLSSMDELVDLGLKNLPGEKKGTTLFVDIGSGCGRLLLYTGMTRGTNEETWNIHGIEIAPLLHNIASEYLGMGIAEGFFSASSSNSSANSVHLHLGPAEDFADILNQADIIFAYSTAFPSTSFSPELGAMILDPGWSRLLSESCRNGCVAITTDRALDPAFGWELVDRLDVANQEVFGSTGYIHILK